MRFIFNKFPDDANFQPDSEWTPLKESSNLWIVQLQAIPFMVINIEIMLLLMKAIKINFQLNTNTMLISFLIFIPIHELLHALFFPEKLSSKKVFFGFTLKGLAPFAAYIGEMKRNTFIRVLLAPFILITLLGFFYLIFIGRNELIEHILVFNALGASGDCFYTYLLLRQVPKNAIVKNKKIRTFWKNQNI